MSCKRTCKYYKTGSTVPGKRNTKRAQQARKKKKDYRVEYNKTEEATKKRSELVRLNREYQKKGLGKVGDGKDVSHKPGGKTTLESASKNRGGKTMSGDKRARGRKKMQEGGYVLKKTNDSIFKPEYLQLGSVTGNGWGAPHNWNKVKSALNPKNWGVLDYSDKGSRDAAFAAAREAGEEEFIFNGKRFNTRKDTDDLNITMPDKDLNPDWDAEKYNDYLKTNYPEFYKVINRGKGVNEIEFGHHPDLKDQPERASYDLSKNKVYVGSNEIKPDDSAFGRNDALGSIIAEMAHVKDDKLSHNPLKRSAWKSSTEHLRYGENKYNIPNTTEYNTHRLYEPGLAMIAYGDLSPNDIMRIQKHLGVKEDGYFGEITYKAVQEKYKDSPYIQNALEEHEYYTQDKDKNSISMGLFSHLAKAYLHQINQDVPLKDSKRFSDVLNPSDYTDNALLNIKAGSGNYDVEELQYALDARGYELPKSTKEGGGFDGIWGDETKNALLDYQKKNQPINPLLDNQKKNDPRRYPSLDNQPIINPLTGNQLANGGSGKNLKKMQSGGVIKRRGSLLQHDGRESTHLMAREYIPGKGWVVFPTLFQNEDNSWLDLSKDSSWEPAYEEAQKRGEVYEFGDDEEKAIEFADKGSWKTNSLKRGGQINPWLNKKYGGIFQEEECLPCQQKKMQQGGIAPPLYNTLSLLLRGSGGNEDEDMNATRDIIELQDTTTMGVGTSKDIFPIYEDLNDFYEINKDRSVILPDKNQVLGLEGGKFEETPLFMKGKTTHYCYPYSENANCMVRANTLVNALIPGNNYYKSSDETLKDIGVTYTTQHKPTEEEKAKYPYMEFDENFGSLDSWDITHQMQEFSPKNVLFDAMNGNRTLSREELKNNSLSINDLMRDYKDQIQVGSYITLGTQYGSDGRQVLGGSHTVRVVGFKPNGMPIVADHGEVKELADAMYIDGDLDAKKIRSILGVPGKEKYTFGYFNNKRQNMEIPSNERYIKDHNNLPSYPESVNKRENVKASENFVKFEKTLGDNKNYITSVLDISPAEYDEYAKIALAISGSETEYGTSNVYKYLRDFKKSEGVSQLRMENVENIYPKILSKYKKGSEEYNSLATILYVNEINKYRKKWMKQGSRPQERPYTKDNFGATDAVRRLGQGRTKQGYVGRISQDVFRSEGESVEIPNRRLFEGKDRYKNRVNTELQKVSGVLADKLRFDFDEDGNRVIFKKTPGNTIPNTLRDVAFYAWQTPRTVIYGDAAGDSNYYKKNKKIYDNLFE